VNISQPKLRSEKFDDDDDDDDNSNNTDNNNNYYFNSCETEVMLKYLNIQECSNL